MNLAPTLEIIKLLLNLSKYAELKFSRYAIANFLVFSLRFKNIFRSLSIKSEMSLVFFYIIIFEKSKPGVI